MKLLRKLLAVVLVLIVVLAIVVVVVVGSFGGRAVKLGINKGASKFLPVDVNVADVDLSVLGGKLTLHNLLIGNPEGYQHKNLLELKTGAVKVNVRSLLSDTVKINKINLDGAVVVLEQKDLLRNNIQDVIKALPKSEEAETDAQAEGKKLQIDELVISNTTVKVKLLPVPGKVDTIPLKLATIKMTNLGGDNKLSVPTLIGKILSAITRGIAEQGAGILPDDMLKGLSTTLGKTLDLGKDIIKEGAKVGEKALEEAQDAGKKILDGAGDVGKGVGDGLKGLLPGKKKEQ